MVSETWRHPAGATAPAPPPRRWDASAAVQRNCALATAAATRNEVVLNLGTKTDLADGEVAADLIRQLAMSPATAKNLRALLARAIGDYDRGRRGR